MPVRVSRGKDGEGEQGPPANEEAAPRAPRRGRKQVKRREVESRSEGAELEGKKPADGRKVNLGYRLTVKRTDDDVRAAVGDYGSVEVSVSLYEDVPAGSADEEYARIRESVETKVDEAFTQLGLGNADDEDGDGD